MDDTTTSLRLQRQIDELLAQRASEWLERLRQADPTERAAFIDWLSESKLHVQEFLEVAAVDRELAQLDPAREEDVDALLAEIAPGVATLQPNSRAAQSAAPALSSRWSRWSRSRWRNWQRGALLAAGVAGVAVALSFTMLRKEIGSANSSFATQIGEQRTIELSDSSIVQLNTDSRIDFRVGNRERNVRLVHGEALFKVAEDRERPFRVLARAGTAQAVGTQFNVYDRPDGTRVSVLDGRVRVTSNADGSEQLLEKGQEALIKLGGGIELDSAANAARAVVWQQQRLVFDNAPLEDMVREFNRYNRSQQIELRDVPSGLHHYDGIFDAMDPDSLAALLSHESDLAVDREDGRIVVRTKLAGAGK